MNYIVRTSIGGETIPLIVGSKVDGTWYDVLHILSSDLTEDMNLDSREGCDVPLLVPEDDQDESTTTDLSNLFKIMSKSNLNCSDTLLDRLAEQLKGLFDVNDLKMIQNLFIVNKDYLSGNCNVIIKVSRTRYVFENNTRTLELVNSINSSGDTEELVVEGENKTVFMEDENDEFFMTVPSIYELSILNPPLPPDVYKPYKGNSVLSTPMYKRSTSDLEVVEGNPENNDLPIQGNEKRYYNALLSLMKQGIAKEFPDKDPDECLNSNIGSNLVKEYLTNVALYGLFMNWRHTGCVPMNLNEELCDVTDIDSDALDNQVEGIEGADNVEGNRSFYSSNGSVMMDYSELLRDICNIIFSENPKYLIEFAIKMNRFGKRKPTRIGLPDGRYLDLNNHRVVKSNGNYSQAEEVVDEEGNNAEVVVIINFSNYMTDKDYIKKFNVRNTTIDMPVGLCCKKTYKTGESKLLFTSFIDVMESYKSKNNRIKIKGLKYDEATDTFSSDPIEFDNKPTFSLGEAIEAVSNSSASYFNYDGFVEAFMDKNAYDPRLSILKIMKEYYPSDNLSVLEISRYDSLEELDDLIKIQRLPPRGIIERNIASYVLFILNGANDRYVSASETSDKDFTIGDFLNYFNQSANSIDFNGNFGKEDFLKPKDELKSSSSFGNTNVENGEEEDEDMSKKLLSSNTDGMIFAEVVLTKDDYEILKDKVKIVNLGEKTTSINKVATSVVLIGYIALKIDPETRKPKGLKVFMDTDFKPEKCSAVLDARKLTPALVDNITAMMNGKETTYKYASQDACNYYCGIIASLTNYYLRK